MRILIFLLGLSILISGSARELNSFSKAKMFSLSSEEMVFASKLSDENRHRFCYTFSVKERSLAMKGNDLAVLPDQKVEQVFTSLYAQLEPKIQTR
jgi:hypothetical protein